MVQKEPMVVQDKVMHVYPPPNAEVPAFCGQKMSMVGPEPVPVVQTAPATAVEQIMPSGVEERDETLPSSTMFLVLCT